MTEDLITSIFKPHAVHSIHFPVSARSFIQPVVAHLIGAGVPSELWVEDHPRHQAVIEGLTVPKRLVDSDLSINLFKFFRRLSSYRRQLRAQMPRVLHVHQARASVIPLLAARLEGVPFRIYQNHGLPYLGYSGPMRWMLRTIERLNISLATHVLLVSKSNLAAAREDGLLSRDQGVVLAHGSAVGIDLDHFTPEQFSSRSQRNARSNLGIPEYAFVLGYVGRPVRRKGLHLLLDAWKRMGLGDRGNILLIAGCTQEECARVPNGTTAGVRGLGYMTDLRPFYAASDVVTLPSEHEGFPYSMLEGAAASRPLIGTDIPGIRCAIVHEQTGLLVPNKDPVALAAAIQRLASDPALRERFGRNARARVEQYFDRKIVLEALLHFYQDNGMIQNPVSVENILSTIGEPLAVLPPQRHDV